MKGKALRKHSLHEKTAASVLLKLLKLILWYLNIPSIDLAIQFKIRMYMLIKRYLRFTEINR